MGYGGLHWGIYKVLEAGDEHAKAMAELEATLKAQETPKEAAARRPKEIRAAIIASIIVTPLVLWFDWLNIDSFHFLTMMRLMSSTSVWCFAYSFFGPPSRASVAIAEYRRQLAEQEAAHNAAIRRQKIERGL
jgi:hypothetical protein